VQRQLPLHELSTLKDSIDGGARARTTKSPIPVCAESQKQKRPIISDQPFLLERIAN
jgi:hypothetical protein